MQVSLELKVINGIDAFLAEAGDWDALVSETRADIYFRMSWLRIWLRHHGAGKSFQVVLVSNGSTLVGGLPFAIETIWVGPIPVKVAKLAAADPNYAYLTAPIKKDHESAAVPQILACLFDSTDVDVVSLSPISELCSLNQIATGVSTQGDKYDLVTRKQETRLHTIMRLPGRFEEFLAGLSKSRRKEYRKDTNRLNSVTTLNSRVSTGEQGKERFSAFVDLHQQQWQAAGRSGHFDDWPSSREFYLDLFSEFGGDKNICVDEAFGDEQLLSSQFCFVQHDVCYWRLTARTLDPDMMKLGVGRVGLVQRVERLISEGIRLIEVGAGQYDYKTSYGGEEVNLNSIILCRANRYSRVKSRFLFAWADFVHLIYYRIWVIKIAPRFRIRGKSLWRTWIRTRL